MIAGFAVVHQKTHQVTRLSHKAEAEDLAWLLGQNRPDWFGVVGRQKIRGGGHTLGLKGLRRGYARSGLRAFVPWCYEDNFPNCPWWACILVLALGVF
jgi:hypothetical protein